MTSLEIISQAVVQDAPVKTMVTRSGKPAQPEPTTSLERISCQSWPLNELPQDLCVNISFDVLKLGSLPEQEAEHCEECREQ